MYYLACNCIHVMLKCITLHVSTICVDCIMSHVNVSTICVDCITSQVNISTLCVDWITSHVNVSMQHLQENHTWVVHMVVKLFLLTGFFLYYVYINGDVFRCIF